MLFTRMNVKTRRQALAEHVGLEVDQIDALLVRCKAQLPARTYDMLTAFFAADATESTVRQLSSRYDLSKSRVLEIIRRAADALRERVAEEEMPDNPLDASVEQFFTNARAQRAGLEITVRRIISALRNEYEVYDPETRTSTQLGDMRWFVNEVTGQTLLEMPNLSRKSVEHVKAMLATVGLLLKP